MALEPHILLRAAMSGATLEESPFFRPLVVDDVLWDKRTTLSEREAKAPLAVGFAPVRPRTHVAFKCVAAGVARTLLCSCRARLRRRVRISPRDCTPCRRPPAGRGPLSLACARSYLCWSGQDSHTSSVSGGAGRAAGSQQQGHSSAHLVAGARAAARERSEAHQGHWPH
jgi:hypothetical protein